MSIDLNKAAPTEITIRPEAKARPVPSFQKATLGDEKPGQTSEFWGKDGFGFDDFVDLINPLQHIPVVSHIYRAMTGDEIAPGLRMVGSALLGGPLGLAATGASMIAEQEMGGTALASTASPAVPIKQASAASLPPALPPLAENQEAQAAAENAQLVLAKAKLEQASKEMAVNDLTLNALSMPQSAGAADKPASEEDKQASAILDLFESEAAATAPQAAANQRYQRNQQVMQLVQQAADLSG